MLLWQFANYKAVSKIITMITRTRCFLCLKTGYMLLKTKQVKILWVVEFYFCEETTLIKESI